MTMILPWLVAALSLAIALWALKFGLKERRRRKGRPLIDRSPIPLVPLEAVDPVFRPGQLGYSRDTEVALIGDSGAIATTSETEAWILCTLAKRAKRIFEFGTATGRTAYLLARNAPPDAEVITLTLSPETLDQYIPGWEDDDEEKRWEKVALNESSYGAFFYEGTEVADKITQLIGDSKIFDDAPYGKSCDLIFVDGSHAYSYVASDSEKAMRMIRPGGLIVWHDFSPPVPGVWRYLNELGARRKLQHIRNTRLVVGRF